MAGLMSIHLTRPLAIDVTVSTSVPFLAVWLYEISNVIVLTAQGFSVSLSTDGLLPLGVAGVSSGEPSPFTKGLQIGFAIVMLLPAWFAFSKKRLIISESFVLSTVGVYLASAYWEMLSLVSAFPMMVHVGLFIAGTSAIALALHRGMSRDLQLRHGSSTPGSSQVPSSRIWLQKQYPAMTN